METMTLAPTLTPTVMPAEAQWLRKDRGVPVDPISEATLDRLIARMGPDYAEEHQDEKGREEARLDFVALRTVVLVDLHEATEDNWITTAAKELCHAIGGTWEG